MDDDGIFDASEVPPVRRARAFRYPQILKLTPGKAVIISWATIGNYVVDGPGSVRKAAWYWAKRAGWKLRTQADERGVYVIRDK